MEKHTTDEIVVAKVYNNIAEALTAKERLEERGIVATIEDMNVVGLTPLAGVEVKVFEKDLEQALDILGADD